MTRDDIIRMAREAGMAPHFGHTDDDGKHHPAVNALKTSVPVEWLERFAALVAAAEREACALIAEDGDNEERCTGYYDQLGDAKATARNIAAAIRQRGAA